MGEGVILDNWYISKGDKTNTTRFLFNFVVGLAFEAAKAFDGED
jgi:hypothetical protein